MMEAITRFPDDESVKDVLVGAIEFLSQQLGGMTMNDNFKPYVNVSLGLSNPDVLSLHIYRLFDSLFSIRHSSTLSYNHRDSSLPL